MKTPLAIASGNPWTLVRAAVVVAAYLALIGFGLVQLANADPAGIVYAGGAVVGLVFLPRRGVTTFVWVVLGCDGAVRFVLGDSWRGTEVVGAVIAGVLTALPWSTNEVALGEATDSSEPTAAAAVLGPELAPREGIHIRTLGRFELWVDGVDHAPTLRKKGALNYLFHYLLARALEAPGQPIPRELAGDDLYPSVSLSTQRERVRKRLSELRAVVPARLREAIGGTEKEVSFDPREASTDVRALRALAAEAVAGQAPEPDLLARLEDAYRRLGKGEFLPEWESLAIDYGGAQAPDRRLLEPLRREIEGWRADVVLALALAYAAQRQPARAIPLLEQALELSPEREDVAERLAATYLITGQTERARKLRRGYQLSEV